MVTFERGVNSGFPAANHRWETPLSIVLFSAVFLFASVTASGVAIHQEPGKSKQNAAKPAATQASPQKRPTWRVKVIENFGVPFVSVHAKKAPLSDVAAEIALRLKIPVHLTDKAKQQLLTTDFDGFPLDRAVRLLSAHPVIDYVMNGGADPMYPVRKKALTIYLLGQDEKPPDVPPWIMKDPSTEMWVWDVAAVSLEELTNTWFPSGIRLYSRTDLEKDVSKPLRLTIEPNQDAQAEQNVTP